MNAQKTPSNVDNGGARLVLKHLSTAVIHLNQQWKVVYINPAAELLLSRSGKRLLGMPFDSLFAHSKSIHSALKNAKRHNTLSVRSTEWHLLSGQNIYVDFTITPCLEDWLIEATPSHDKRASRQSDVLEHREATRHLVRGVAHEIKNPLGGIRGAAQLLATELPDSSLQEYTQVIIEEADRLRLLVDRMLGSHQRLNKQTINIHQITERVFALLKVEAGQRILINRDYDPSIPNIQADEAQLIQALLNLARNAFQALIEHQNPDPKLIFRTRSMRQFTIRQRCHRLVVNIDVIDNGPGISPDMIEKIFYPMVSNRPQGTGLGLSLAQQIIHAHQGSIECSSQPNNTRFSLYLPLEAGNE